MMFHLYYTGLSKAKPVTIVVSVQDVNKKEWANIQLLVFAHVLIECSLKIIGQEQIDDHEKDLLLKDRR